MGKGRKLTHCCAGGRNPDRPPVLTQSHVGDSLAGNTVSNLRMVSTMTSVPRGKVSWNRAPNRVKCLVCDAFYFDENDKQPQHNHGYERFGICAECKRAILTFKAILVHEKDVAMGD